MSRNSHNEQLQKVLKELAKFGKDAENAVKAVTAAAALDISADATEKAPKAFGTLRQSINPQKENDYLWSVNVNAEYGAFVEFGTGAKVKVPNELADVAVQYMGMKGGTFDELMERIKLWCAQKGINVSAAYPIAASILRQGIEPQPYLYPAYKKGQKQYLEDLKHALQQLEAKYG